MVNPALSDGLATVSRSRRGVAFRIHDGQVTARLGEREKIYAHPASADSLLLREQGRLCLHGNDRRIKLKRVVENTRNVMAIEAMAAAQAVDFLAPLKPSKRGQAGWQPFEACLRRSRKTGVMAGDFERFSALLGTGRLAELVR